MTEFSRPIPLAEIDRRPVTRRIEALPAEESALAARLGVEMLSGLKAEVTVAKRRGVVSVTGLFEVRLCQACVVTLEPFTAILQGEIDETYTEVDDMDEAGEVEIDIETPEPLAGDILDVGEVVVQCLALEIDPHPRAPEADLASLEAPELDAIDPAGPFAALGKLRGNS